MDLVQEAGVDVSDWRNYKNGINAPGANPKYCYEWVFRGRSDLIVLNVWHQELQMDGSQLVLRGNMRNIAQPKNTSGMNVRAARARRFDDALRDAWRGGLQIRAIICSGSRRSLENPEVASRVNGRLLDPVPWSVKSYEDISGNFVLVRGEFVPVVRDQFELGIAEQSPTEIRMKTGAIFVRNAEVRRLAIVRSKGRCELCRERGFTLPDGSGYLETHHVVPLSEGGPDTLMNVAALCANHHREAHYGAARDDIKARLVAVIEPLVALSQQHGVGHSL
jgi:hypothetical protein